MMELTSENVEAIVEDCLFDEDIHENRQAAVIVEGVIRKFGFDPEKIEQHAEDIGAMLKQLPSEFQEEGGGGWSFLNACMKTDGSQWTDLHQIQEALLVLGIAAGWAKISLPRDMWKALPGGVPYFVVFKNRKASDQ